MWYTQCPYFSVEAMRRKKVELTPIQYGRIAPLLPGQWGHAGLSNLQVPMPFPA